MRLQIPGKTMNCWMPPTATVWSAGVRPSSSARTRRWCGKRPSRAAVGKGRCCLSPLQSGGGEWEYKRRLPEKWKISCGEGEDKLTLIVSPTGFKHTGVFPEQAVNWAWYAKKIRAAGRPVKVLNLFGYTGGATLACAAAGATVCHVDASKGIVAWGKDNAAASGLATGPSAGWWTTVPSSLPRKAPRQHLRRIIMDPPSYGRGPGGEIWKLEDCIYDLISQCEEVLSDTPLFFAVNSYTTGLSPAVMEYMLKTTLVPRFGGETSCDEIGLPVSATGGVVPAAQPPSGKNKERTLSVALRRQLPERGAFSKSLR